MRLQGHMDLSLPQPVTHISLTSKTVIVSKQKLYCVPLDLLQPLAQALVWDQT